MSWQDRIGPAAYTSPSGLRFEFQYENVSVESDKKSGIFIFPEIDGQYVQDLKRAGRRYPLTIFFSGEDYDLESDSFLEALEEVGIGTLEHPLYGTKKVVPVGTITRRDDLAAGANQAAFSVSFSETIEDINFPASTVNEKEDIKNSIAELNASTTEQFAESLVPESESETAILQNSITDTKDEFITEMESIINSDDEISNAVTLVSDSIDNNILELVTNPGGAASQVITLINTPSNATSTAASFIQGYGSIIDTVINKTVETASQYFTNLLFNSSAFGAVSNSMLNVEFLNRPDAITALESMTDIYDNITEWMDENITALGIQDPGDIYYALNKLFGKISGYLVRLSFDLPKKIILTLQEDRNIIELVAELYQDLDMIDFFIQTNNLTSDEIELLPLGKEVIYFA